MSFADWLLAGDPVDLGSASPWIQLGNNGHNSEEPFLLTSDMTNYNMASPRAHVVINNYLAHSYIVWQPVDLKFDQPEGDFSLEIIAMSPVDPPPLDR